MNICDAQEFIEENGEPALIGVYVWVQGAENDAYWNPIKSTQRYSLQEVDKAFDEWLEEARKRKPHILETNRFKIMRVQ